MAMSKPRNDQLAPRSARPLCGWWEVLPAAPHKREKPVARGARLALSRDRERLADNGIRRLDSRTTGSLTRTMRW